MSRDDPHFRLRIPEPERDFIRKAAGQSLRSMNAEIVFTIRQRMELETKTASESGTTSPAA